MRKNRVNPFIERTICRLLHLYRSWLVSQIDVHFDAELSLRLDRVNYLLEGFNVENS